eukprot:1182046-Prorocentrum_minimum.AAC.1
MRSTVLPTRISVSIIIASRYYKCFRTPSGRPRDDNGKVRARSQPREVTVRGAGDNTGGDNTGARATRLRGMRVT